MAYIIEPDPGSPESDDLEEEDDDNATETEATMRYLSVCVSDVSCSSFTANAASADSLIEQANQALASIYEEDSSRRKLQFEFNGAVGYVTANKDVHLDAGLDPTTTVDPFADLEKEVKAKQGVSLASVHAQQTDTDGDGVVVTSAWYSHAWECREAQYVTGKTYDSCDKFTKQTQYCGKAIRYESTTNRIRTKCERCRMRWGSWRCRKYTCYRYVATAYMAECSANTGPGGLSALHDVLGTKMKWKAITRGKCLADGVKDAPAPSSPSSPGASSSPS